MPQDSDTHVTITGVWNEYKNEARRQELSHWRGVGKWSDEKAWLGVGENTRRRLDAFCRYMDWSPLASRKRAFLEWGPGGGSNLYAMRDVADCYYGVDISGKNLREAGRIAYEGGFGNFCPVLLTGDPPEVIPKIDRPIEVFVSTAVFQHFPSLGYGRDVLGVIREVASSRAFGIIQIRYDDGDPKFTPIDSIEQYRKSFITATAYRIEAFAEMARNAGFDPVLVGHVNPKTHYATVYLRAV